MDSIDEGRPFDRHFSRGGLRPPIVPGSEGGLRPPLQGSDQSERASLDTDAFYRSSCDAGYVKLDSVARNIAWTTPTTWGDIEITINLSKPEKDPRAIATAAHAGAAGERSYVDPATGRERACPLCVEQADIDCGYAAPISIGGERWGLWYSPYAYYDEHCIAMSWEHRPMHIDRAAFTCLFDVVDSFPQYFFGSNADLPIVGGSILAHDHFQGGRHVFPLQKAPIAERFELEAFPGVEAGIVNWPVSVVRLAGESRRELVDATCMVLDAWCAHDDLEAGIVSGFGAAPAAGSGEGRVFATSRAARSEGRAVMPALSEPRSGEFAGMPFTNDERLARAGAETRPSPLPATGTGGPFSEGAAKGHNTITPILRKEGGAYQLDLALRCNITTDEHPLGVFHPHEELHHIKKENIGLIEVMGLAILPPRVKQVMADQGLSRDDVGALFARVLEDAGVFKWDRSGRAALHRFIERICYHRADEK